MTCGKYPVHYCPVSHPESQWVSGLGEESCQSSVPLTALVLSHVHGSSDLFRMIARFIFSQSLSATDARVIQKQEEAKCPGENTSMFEITFDL